MNKAIPIKIDVGNDIPSNKASLVFSSMFIIYSIKIPRI